MPPPQPQTGKKGTGKRGADASELGAGGGGGKKRKGKKGSSAQLAEPTDEEIEEALAEMEAELEGEEGGLLKFLKSLKFCIEMCKFRTMGTGRSWRSTLTKKSRRRWQRWRLSWRARRVAAATEFDV